jgi:hypothetical protein
MVIHHSRFLQSWSALLLVAGLLAPALQSPASAGPVARRIQERKACQEFATKLQQASGNPAAAQQVYQQGVLQLVARFGENPCGDIPAPTASGMAAPPATPAAAATTPGPTASPATPAAAKPSAQQQQACQQFAGKLQAASASGGAAAAQQTYAMGLEKLTGMYGSNPCPSVRPPQ